MNVPEWLLLKTWDVEKINKGIEEAVLCTEIDLTSVILLSFVFLVLLSERVTGTLAGSWAAVYFESSFVTSCFSGFLMMLSPSNTDHSFIGECDTLHSSCPNIERHSMTRTLVSPGLKPLLIQSFILWGVASLRCFIFTAQNNLLSPVSDSTAVTHLLREPRF